MSAPSVAAFLEGFPEFVNTNTSKPLLVSRKLAEAMTHVDQLQWLERYEDAVYIKTAHLLSLAPFGEGARLSKSSSETVYSVMWDQALKALPVRMMII